jgi:predicted SnoaL-like aldol condensation-catalyzing enzyme
MNRTFNLGEWRVAGVLAMAVGLSGCPSLSGPVPEGGRAMASGGHNMDLEENKALARRIIEEAFNRRTPSTLEPLVAPGFRSHNPRIPPGPGGLAAFARGFLEGFADFTGRIGDVVAEGDRVVVYVDWQGTHTGTFAGVAPTGRRVEFATVEIFRFTGGKLVEHRDVVDRLALLTGLGLVPSGS